MGDFPHPFGALGSGFEPAGAPLPILATWNPGIRQLLVQFDQQLVPGPVDALNWSIFTPGTWFRGTAASAFGGFVSVAMGPVGPWFGPNTVSFMPPPFDVLNLDYVPAAGFTGFPWS